MLQREFIGPNQPQVMQQLGGVMPRVTTVANAFCCCYQQHHKLPHCNTFPQCHLQVLDGLWALKPPATVMFSPKSFANTNTLTIQDSFGLELTKIANNATLRYHFFVFQISTQMRLH
jgi:hypothetical protein